MIEPTTLAGHWTISGDRVRRQDSAGESGKGRVAPLLVNQQCVLCLLFSLFLLDREVRQLGNILVNRIAPTQQPASQTKGQSCRPRLARAILKERNEH